jgi:hypothetical protein
LETNRESFDQETTPDLSGRRSRWVKTFFALSLSRLFSSFHPVWKISPVSLPSSLYLSDSATRRLGDSRLVCCSSLSSVSLLF